MVSLTSRAAEQVKAFRKTEGIGEDVALRLLVGGGGCSGFTYDLFFDATKPSDRVYESEGIRLIVDQASLRYLGGTEVDYVEAAEGVGFSFINPNVKSVCGCSSASCDSRPSHGST
jgi:iron-sulfur cluster assembly accessory protein